MEREHSQCQPMLSRFGNMAVAIVSILLRLGQTLLMTRHERARAPRHLLLEGTLCGDFYGTKAMTMGHRGNCLRELSGLQSVGNKDIFFSLPICDCVLGLLLVCLGNSVDNLSSVLVGII